MEVLSRVTSRKGREEVMPRVDRRRGETYIVIWLRTPNVVAREKNDKPIVVV